MTAPPPLAQDLATVRAQRDRLLDVLAGVMRHLASTGGSPEEHADFRAAFAELAAAGRAIGDKEREQMELAHAQWEARRK